MLARNQTLLLSDEQCLAGVNGYIGMHLCIVCDSWNLIHHMLPCVRWCIRWLLKSSGGGRTTVYAFEDAWWLLTRRWYCHLREFIFKVEMKNFDQSADLTMTSHAARRSCKQAINRLCRTRGHKGWDEGGLRQSWLRTQIGMTLPATCGCWEERLCRNIRCTNKLTVPCVKIFRLTTACVVEILFNSPHWRRYRRYLPNNESWNEALIDTIIAIERAYNLLRMIECWLLRSTSN